MSYRIANMDQIDKRFGISIGLDQNSGDFLLPDQLRRRDNSIYLHPSDLIFYGTTEVVIEAKDHQGLVSEPVSFTLTLTSRDVDGDGLTNQWEEEHELLVDRIDSDENGIPDGQEDWDQDGLTNFDEMTFSTNPRASDQVTRVSLPDVQVSRGGVFQLPITLQPSDSIPLSKFRLGLLIDEKYFDVEDVTAVGLPTGWDFDIMRSPPKPGGATLINLIGYSKGDSVLNGTVELKLYLYVKRDVDGNIEIPLNLAAESASFNSDDIEVPLVSTHGSMYVSDDLLEEVTLKGRWSLIGLPLDVSADAIESLEAQVDDLQSIWGFENGQWRIHSPNYPAALSNLKGLEVGKGYWVEKGSEDTVIVRFSGISIEDVPLDIEPGWNLISMASKGDSIYTILDQAEAESVWLYDEGWKSYIQGTPEFLNTLNQMDVGVGYYVYKE